MWRQRLAVITPLRIVAIFAIAIFGKVEDNEEFISVSIRMKNVTDILFFIFMSPFTRLPRGVINSGDYVCKSEICSKRIFNVSKARTEAVCESDLKAEYTTKIARNNAVKDRTM